MKRRTVSSFEVADRCRFDAKFHLDEGNAAFRRVQAGKWPLTTPADQFGSDCIWSPNRFARVYAAGPEHGKPILVPYDVFRFLPFSEDYLSRSQVAVYPKLELSRGWLLTTCSGRNLGPVTLVDNYCARFVLSHDMIRVAADLDDHLFYFTGFLKTSVGQALLRRDKNGSVIDHTSPQHVAGMSYPLVGKVLMRKVAAMVRESFEKRERARESLRTVRESFLEASGLAQHQIRVKKSDRARRFSTRRREVVDRFDAEPFAPMYEAYRKRIHRRANGTLLQDIAEVIKPAGRYKTIYVDAPSYGIPLLSGRQIAQYRPIGLKHMSPAAFKDPDQYRVREGMILTTADGRAQQNLADTVMVTRDRDGWMASGHVHRLQPRRGVAAGLVYLAVSCPPVQAQLKALATGSVVDALSVPDVESVIVPVPDGAEELGQRATQAWKLFAEAKEAEDTATRLLEAELLRDR